MTTVFPKLKRSSGIFMGMAGGEWIVQTGTLLQVGQILLKIDSNTPTLKINHVTVQRYIIFFNMHKYSWTK